MMLSSLELFDECMEALIVSCINRKRRCVLCGKEVFFEPLPKFYAEMNKKLGIESRFQAETLNREEYLCPVCGSSDRDRLIAMFLQKANIRQAAEGFRILQFAPSPGIEMWLKRHCPHTVYESADLFMENVTCQADIQNLYMMQEEAYDLIICSHVLEHVQDDRKALREMKRILKPEGKIVFLVPVDMGTEEIDEQWGLPEEENWRRFGQSDRCRLYGKRGLRERLSEEFYVYALGQEYFGAEAFLQSGLTDTSTLYVLTKSEAVLLDMGEQTAVDEKLCREGPLVSVIMSCYNHSEFVAEAIESVLAQSYKNIEFLVADDGSEDSSPEVMQRYSKHFTKEYYFKDNAGGRFLLLKEQACGKYIALLNSDDVWDKDKLALQVAFLESHREYGACFTWCEYTNERLEPLEDMTFIKGNRSRSEWMKYFWTEGNAICNPSGLILRELSLKAPRYGSACWQLPDFFKWIDMVQTHSIYIIPKLLTKMRRHQSENASNVSACSGRNLVRSMIEEGCNWGWVIRDMEAGFFREAFGNLMINPAAVTEEEIKCEKYFLMLKHYNMFVQNSAFIFLSEVYPAIGNCLAEKYRYTVKELKEDMLAKGIGSSLNITTAT